MHNDEVVTGENRSGRRLLVCRALRRAEAKTARRVGSPKDDKTPEGLNGDGTIISIALPWAEGLSSHDCKFGTSSCPCERIWRGRGPKAHTSSAVLVSLDLQSTVGNLQSLASECAGSLGGHSHHRLKLPRLGAHDSFGHRCVISPPCSLLLAVYDTSRTLFPRVLQPSTAFSACLPLPNLLPLPRNRSSAPSTPLPRTPGSSLAAPSSRPLRATDSWRLGSITG